MVSRSDSLRSATSSVYGGSADSITSSINSPASTDKKSHRRSIFSRSKQSTNPSTAGNSFGDGKHVYEENYSKVQVGQDGIMNIQAAPTGHIHVLTVNPVLTLNQPQQSQKTVGRSPLGLSSASIANPASFYIPRIPPQDVTKWAISVGALPEVHLVKPAEPIPEIPSELYQLPPGSITFKRQGTFGDLLPTNSDSWGGWCFVRIAQTKLYWTNRAFKASVRLTGGTGTSGLPSSLSSSIPLQALSCLSDSASNEWFLLDMKQTLTQASLELIPLTAPSSRSYLNLRNGLPSNTSAPSLVIELHPTNNASGLDSSGNLSVFGGASKKKGFFAGALERVKSRRGSKADCASGADTPSSQGAQMQPPQIIASVSIPLALLAMDDLNEASQQQSQKEDDISSLLVGHATRASSLGLQGTFYLIDPATSEAAGEITLHAVCTPQTFYIGRAAVNSARASAEQEVKFQAPLTLLSQSTNQPFGQRGSILTNPTTSLFAAPQSWQRVWAIILGNSELLLHDFQRRDYIAQEVGYTTLPLQRIVKLDYHPNKYSNPGALLVNSSLPAVEHLIEIWFDQDNSNNLKNQAPINYYNSSQGQMVSQQQQHARDADQITKIYAYADDEASALAWINNLSLVIWNEPFNYNKDNNNQEPLASPKNNSGSSAGLIGGAMHRIRAIAAYN